MPQSNISIPPTVPRFLNMGLKLGSRRRLSTSARLEKVTQSQPCLRRFDWLPNTHLHERSCVRHRGWQT